MLALRHCVTENDSHGKITTLARSRSLRTWSTERFARTCQIAPNRRTPSALRKHCSRSDESDAILGDA